MCGATQLSVEPLYTAPSNMLSRSQVLTKDANRWQNCVRTGICRLEFQVLSPPLAGDGKVSKVLRTSKPPCFHLESGSLAASISMLMIGSDVGILETLKRVTGLLTRLNCFKAITRDEEKIKLREGDRGHEVERTKVPQRESLVIGKRLALRVSQGEHQQAGVGM